MESELQKRINKEGLAISRLPEWAKEVIVSRANLEFCGDYGMCLADIVSSYLEYERLKDLFFSGNIPSIDSVKEQIKTVKFADGKILNLIKGGETDGTR